MITNDISQINSAEKLAREILILSRNTLLVNLRFLDMALSQFEYYAIKELTLLTDGRRILFNPMHVLRCYKTQKEIPVRDYLHMVMHCVFRHMFMSPSINRSLWDLACDIAVENTITDLWLKSTHADRENQQTDFIAELKRKIKLITAEKVYNYLVDNKISQEKAENIRKAFFADNHEIWYMSEEEIVTAFGLSSTAGNHNDGEGDSNDRGNGADNRSMQPGNIISREQLSANWEKISQRMQMDMETFSKQQGVQAGGLIQNLMEVNREKYDYTAFLKKFATMGEVMKVNEDEFDYIFYTYGLSLYGNVPLIEPLEYKEVKRIKEFVIAIDTSGSTSEELVQKFVQKTYNILKSTESFFSKINLHIIQCDAKIQQDVKIRNQGEFDHYLETMTLHGMEGTDFRPVFTYVDELIKNKEFTNLKGLIYFTDGYGNFPARKPDYETAFVFVDDNYNNYDVPPWAMKLILQKNDI